MLGFVSPTPTGTVSAGTELVLAGDDDARTFVLVDDVDVVAGIRVEVVDGAVRPGDSVRFVVTGTFVATGVVSMYVEVDAPRIAPSWSPDAVDVAPASTIAWTAVGADGTRAAVTMDDSTGGFRRAGLLRFDWPDVWQVAGSGDRSLEARLVDGFHTEPIRIERVVVNAGVAEHRVPVRADVSDQVGRFLPLPHQRIVLPAGSAGAVLDGPDDLRVELQEADGESHDWPGVRTWVGVGPADRAVRVDRDRGHVEFGDGRRGRIRVRSTEELPSWHTTSAVVRPATCRPNGRGAVTARHSRRSAWSPRSVPTPSRWRRAVSARWTHSAPYTGP